MEPNVFEEYVDNLQHVKKVLSYNDDEKKQIVTKETKTLHTLQRVCMPNQIFKKVIN